MGGRACVSQGHAEWGQARQEPEGGCKADVQTLGTGAPFSSCTLLPGPRTLLTHGPC